MRADGFCPLPSPLHLPNLATFDFGLSVSLVSLSVPLSFPRSFSSLPSCCLPSLNRTRSDPIQKSPRHPLRRVLLPVAHPKNIPRLIQPPCAPISHVHSGSLLRWQPLVEFRLFIDTARTLTHHPREMHRCRKTNDFVVQRYRSDYTDDGQAKEI